MKTYISDLIPKLERFSKKLDNLTLLTNQHWVVIDELSNSKNIYIFRSNSELLISHNGKVEKAKWEYLGNNSLLIDKKDESYLFKHGFFDENVLALKIDGRNEYAFLVNENKFEKELNSLESVTNFLELKYTTNNAVSINTVDSVNIKTPPIEYQTSKGIIKIPRTLNRIGQPITLNDLPAPDGKYKLYFMDYIYVSNGLIVKQSFY